MDELRPRDSDRRKPYRCYYGDEQTQIEREKFEPHIDSREKHN